MPDTSFLASSVRSTRAARQWGVIVLADPVGARAQFGVSKHIKQRHLDDRCVEELRTLGDCRANEEVTLAAANYSKPAWTRDLAADQVLGNGDKIVPCRLLRCPLGGLVPLWAKLAAPAHVRYDIGIALFEPEPPAGPQIRGLKRDLEAAIEREVSELRRQS